MVKNRLISGEHRWLLLFLVGALFIYTVGSAYGMPIPLIADEVAELKNIYGMIQQKTLVMPYASSYSVWIHLFYIPPTLLYWGVSYLGGEYSDFASFRFYLLNHYTDVLPFLRAFTGLFFVFSVVYFSRVLQELYGRVYGYLFIVLSLLNLIFITNAHTIKHWAPAFSLILVALALYGRYLRHRSLFLFLSALFLFWCAVFMNYVMLVGAFYFVYLFYSVHRSSLELPRLFKESMLFVIVGILVYTLSGVLGAGGNSMLASRGILSILDINANNITSYSLMQFYYNPLLTAFAVSAVLLAVYRKLFSILALLVPYVAVVIVMASYPVIGKYYILIHIAVLIPLALYPLVRLFQVRRRAFFAVIGLYVVYNLGMILWWLQIISQQDTRQLTRTWLLENMDRKDFIIYNPYGFNYIPLTTESIRVIEEVVPEAITTRERLHLKYGLEDGLNGVLAWKLKKSDQPMEAIVDNLKAKGYTPVFVHEQFGKELWMNDYTKCAFKNVEDHYRLRQIKEFSPFRESEENYLEKSGDILLEFANPYFHLLNLRRSGPVISIYRIEGRK